MIQVLMKILVLFLLFTFYGCGGTSDVDETNPSVTTNNKFTITNTPDIATAIVVLAEGIIETSELIESEVYWLYHSPNNIFIRHCRSGGTVTWQLDSNSKLNNVGRMIYDNCIIEDPRHSSEFILVPVYNGFVDVSYVIMPSDIINSESKKHYIDTVEISMMTDALIVSEFNNIDNVRSISFDLSTNIQQRWLDTNSDILTKESTSKSIDIRNFSASLFSGKNETITNGVANQYEGIEKNIANHFYQYTLNAKYTSEEFNFTADYEIDLFNNLENPYELNLIEQIDGYIRATLDEENVSVVFDFANLRVSSSSGFSGEALANELVDDFIFRLPDPSSLYSQIELNTPFALVRTSPENQQITEALEELVFIFNKDISDDSTTEYSVLVNDIVVNERFIAQKTSNHITIDLNDLLSYETMQYPGADKLLDINLSIAEFIHKVGEPVQGNVVFIREGYGDLLKLDEPIYNADFLPISKEIIATHVSGEDSKLLAFNSSGISVEKEFIDFFAEYLCVNSVENNIYVSKDDEEGVSLIRLDEDFLLESVVDDISYYSNFNNSSTRGVNCRNDHMFFYTHERVSYYDFEARDWIEIDRIAHNMYPILNPNNKNIIYSLNDTFGWEIITSNYSEIPFTQSSVALDFLPIPDNNENSYGLGRQRLFIDSERNQLYFYNWVLDINDGFNLLYEFENINVLNGLEFVRYINEEKQLIVTSNAVYRMGSFEKLVDLPYLNLQKNDPSWFVDDEDRVNFLFTDRTLYRTKSLKEFFVK